MSNELKSYIEKALSQGRNKAQIHETLKGAGWSENIIDKILNQYSGVDEYGIPVPAPQLKAHHLAKDLFLYILSLVTLSLIAFALGGLLFKLIERYFPDPITKYYGSASFISWAIAQLIITFPVYTWISMIIQKDLKFNPEKRASFVRKLLIYLILTITSVTALSDLIYLLQNFLQGDLTIRFLLKSLVVFGICSLIFAHYFIEVKKDDAFLKDLKS